MIKRFRNIKSCYLLGRQYYADPYHNKVRNINIEQQSKAITRSIVINHLISLFDRATTYLEIGVRNPADNFDKIQADTKYSVDPGVEYKENPVDFKLTSDDFFSQLRENKILSHEIQFDLIFIDGLHLAEQVDRDIKNSLEFIKDDGFIVLHDCCPPSEWHARESYEYMKSPALGSWNGTTWKAFLKYRFDDSLFSCCVNTDWGIGIISKKNPIGKSIKPTNPFFEYKLLDQNRKEYLNLIEFGEFEKLTSQFQFK